MSVNESISAYSTTAASNTPQGTSNIGVDLDDYLRDVKKNVRILSDIVSAATSQVFISADAADALFVTVGTAFTIEDTLSGGGSFASGVNVSLQNASIATSNTATGRFTPTRIDQYGRVLNYLPFTDNAASNKDTFSASSTELYVTPASITFHQAVARVYTCFDGSGTASSYLSWNLDSVVRSSAGTYVVDFSSAPLTGIHCVANVSWGMGVSGNTLTLGSATRTTTSYKFKLVRCSDGVAQDSKDLISVTIFGRLASMIV